jgi:hypothetical protein
VEWKTHKIHLAKNKEIFDAELFAMAEVLKLANRHFMGSKQTHIIQIMTDSSAALRGMQDPNLGLVQWVTKRILERE